MIENHSNLNVFKLMWFCAKLFFNVSLLNASATLNSDIFEKIQKQCGFMLNCIILKTSLNHWKIYLQITCFKKKKVNMLDFQHILFKQIIQVTDIFKIIMFMNFIDEVCKTCELFLK